MLICVDAPKFIKVFRRNESGEGARRVRLGIIMKGTNDFRADAKAAVTATETAEIQKVVASYQAADDARARAEALGFPEIARRVADYYAEHATDVEKGLISAALVELTRAVRKVGKSA